MAASAFARGTGPRRTASETVVASVIRPERSTMPARAVNPSSHGVGKTKWSFAQIVAKPHSLAESTAPASRSNESGSSPSRISGRCTASSTWLMLPASERI